MESIAGRHPWSATFELTARCNLRCEMCLVRVDRERMRALGKRELTAQEWVSLASQARDMGTLSLLLTGGEPTLRADYPEIHEAVSRMGFSLTLYTNATLLTPRVREALRRFPPHKIGVTVYGASPATYGKVCGDEDAFHRLLDGVAFLRTLPSRLEARSTIIRDNAEDFDAVRSLVASWDPEMPFTVTTVVNRQVRGSVSDAAACRLTPEEHLRLIRRATERAIGDFMTRGEADRVARLRENAQVAQAANSAWKRMPPGATLFGCGAGMEQYAVTYSGELVGCQMMDADGPSVLEGGLLSAWQAYPPSVKWGEADARCLGCAHAAACQSCPAVRLAETGNLCGLPEYHCRMTKLMADASFTAV